MYEVIVPLVERRSSMLNDKGSSPLTRYNKNYP